MDFKQKLKVTIEKMPCELLTDGFVTKADILEYISTDQAEVKEAEVFSKIPWGDGFGISTPLYLSTVIQQPIELRVAMFIYAVIREVCFIKFTEKLSVAKITDDMKDVGNEVIDGVIFYVDVLCANDIAFYKNCDDALSLKDGTDVQLGVTEKSATGWMIAHEILFGAYNEIFAFLNSDKPGHFLYRLMEDEHLTVTLRQRSVYMRVTGDDREVDPRQGLPCVTESIGEITFL